MEMTDILSPRTIHIYVMKVLDVAIRIMETSKTPYEPPLDYVIDIIDDDKSDNRTNPHNHIGVSSQPM
jgi:hypothetical protein